MLQAQTSLTNAVDFTVTDLEGNSHTLFDYLNNGKYVCVDFFAYWCGLVLQHLQNSHQFTTNTVVMLEM